MPIDSPADGFLEISNNGNKTKDFLIDIFQGDGTFEKALEEAQLFPLRDKGEKGISEVFSVEMQRIRDAIQLSTERKNIISTLKGRINTLSIDEIQKQQEFQRQTIELKSKINLISDKSTEREKADLYVEIYEFYEGFEDKERLFELSDLLLSKEQEVDDFHFDFPVYKTTPQGEEEGMYRLVRYGKDKIFTVSFVNYDEEGNQSVRDIVITKN